MIPKCCALIWWLAGHLVPQLSHLHKVTHSLSISQKLERNSLIEPCLQSFGTLADGLAGKSRWAEDAAMTIRSGFLGSDNQQAAHLSLSKSSQYCLRKKKRWQSRVKRRRMTFLLRPPRREGGENSNVRRCGGEIQTGTLTTAVLLANVLPTMVTLTGKEPTWIALHERTSI